MEFLGLIIISILILIICYPIIGLPLAALVAILILMDKIFHTIPLPTASQYIVFYTGVVSAIAITLAIIL